MDEAATQEATRVLPHTVQPDHAARAGRGVISITGSKLYFLIAGYASQLLLPRLLGSPEAFGLYSAALSFVSILNNVLIGATVQVVSKRVSERPDKSASALRQALELQLGLGLLTAGALFGAAPWLARYVLLDPLLTPLFRISAAIVFAYALYSGFVGALNGRQEFLTQARFDMTYTTLRTSGMVGAASLGFGAVGVLYGFALASWLVLLAAAFVVGVGARGERTPLSSWIAFMAPLWLYQLCMNMLMQIDVTLLKRSVAAVLQTQGADFASAAEAASRYVGFYRAAQTFAFVPFQLIQAVTLVILPMVSRALSQGDEQAAAGYVRTALRFALLLLLAVAAPIAGAARGVMQLVYPVAYAAGADALAILAFAMVALALFVIAATIMTGAGRPSLSATVGLGAVVVVVAANIGFVHYAGVGERTLMAAAAGTATGTFVAVLAMGRAVQLRFGVFVPALTGLRSLLAAGAAFTVAHLLPNSSKLLTLVALALGAVVYALVLWLTRELGASDLAAALRLVRRKRA